jgi:hypothetical protein
MYFFVTRINAVNVAFRSITLLPHSLFGIWLSPFEMIAGSLKYPFTCDFFVHNFLRFL